MGCVQSEAIHTQTSSVGSNSKGKPHVFAKTYDMQRSHSAWDQEDKVVETPKDDGDWEQGKNSPTAAFFPGYTTNNQNLEEVQDGVDIPHLLDQERLDSYRDWMNPRRETSVLLTPNQQIYIAKSSSICTEIIGTLDENGAENSTNDILSIQPRRHREMRNPARRRPRESAEDAQAFGDRIDASTREGREVITILLAGALESLFNRAGIGRSHGHPKLHNSFASGQSNSFGESDPRERSQSSPRIDSRTRENFLNEFPSNSKIRRRDQNMSADLSYEGRKEQRIRHFLSPSSIL